MISIVFYVATGVITIVVIHFGFYIYTAKKREGINYKLAIITINNFIIENYEDKHGAKKKFCQEHNIRNHKSFIQAINPDSPIETPKIVAYTLNKVDHEVELVNESIEKKKQA